MRKGSTVECDSRLGGRRGWVEYSRSNDEPLSVTVASALARFSDESVTSTKTCLYDHVDPDALDALFADRHDGTPRGSGEVRFAIDQATVVVRPDSVRVFDGPPR